MMVIIIYLIIYIVGLLCVVCLVICLRYLPKRTPYGNQILGKLKLSEFDGKGWTECIYEVPRKTTGNETEQKMLAELERKLNAIADAAIYAINELKSKKD